MRLFLVLAGMAAALLAYLTYTSRGVAPALVQDRFSERRETFDDWLAACRPGGGCVLTSVVGPRGEAADYILRIETVGPGAPVEMVFVAVRRLVAASSPIEARVDEGAPILFAPLGRMGWLQGPDDPANAYRLSSEKASEKLLPSMRRGRALSLRFWDAAPPVEGERDPAKAAIARFSLIGLSAALAWVEANRLR